MQLYFFIATDLHRMATPPGDSGPSIQKHPKDWYLKENAAVPTRCCQYLCGSLAAATLGKRTIAEPKGPST